MISVLPWNNSSGGGATDTDVGLVRAARRGDRRAFDALVRVYQDPLRGFLVRRVGPAAADDALQETWVAAWSGLPGFTGRSRFKAWLFAIAAHKAADLRDAVGRPWPGCPRRREWSWRCTTTRS